jgi:membrane protein YqaA with SNARE-associated domain
VKGGENMAYDNVKASPTYLPFQSDITYSITSSTASTTYLIGTTGSAFGAVSGYVLNNAASTTSATVELKAGTSVLQTFTVAPGQYKTIFIVGADTIVIKQTGVASPAVTGELHTVLNANPM